jgi:ATP-binding cassette, subfamily B, multidrug efflux pump
MQILKGIQGTATPGPGEPPQTLFAFYWHFVKQAKGWYIATFVASLLVALLDTVIPLFIGRLVSLMESTDRMAAIEREWPVLIGMIALVLVARPAVIMADMMIRWVVLIPGGTSQIRWQSHWHVIRQNWPFFQNDFAGRIANRVMQTAPALRESTMMSIRAVWYIGAYGITAFTLLAIVDWRLAMPILLWFIGYVWFLVRYVPRLRDLSRVSSEQRSIVMARVVDSYSNILTVKLFARMKDEDAYVREAVDDHQAAMKAHQGFTAGIMFVLTLLNAALLVGTAAVGLWLWAHGAVSAGVVATALPLAWQTTNAAGWVSWEVSSIFENVGVVQEGMQSIAVPHGGADRPDAKPLEVSRGEVRFEGVTFNYGRKDAAPVVDQLDLEIKPGERVGLVGRSGAGKSTLVNLLLHFYDVDSGRILIDGHDVAGVTQESLRAAIGMVTQDTSLLHRSIAGNIRYGRPWASDAEIVAAAKKAQAHEFILSLRDWRNRSGYEAHVGERGVKLSGGQRQRIALARVLLKNAPILVLDEATSSLDSEVEAAIQDELLDLMQGKTVIAIAHRLSTIARMDRLIVLEHGRIVESGTHADLLRLDGIYAELWRHQSGGFIGNQLDDEEAARAIESARAA